METPDTLCMLVSKLPNGVETLLVNDPIFSREAITAYVGAQEKPDNERKRRSNSKKYGSFATDTDHHQPEVQDKCILCCHKHDLHNCEE